MENYLLGFDRQIIEGFRIGGSFKVPSSYRYCPQIVFAGMGGSGISGEILKALYATRSGVTFSTTRSGIPLPGWINRKTLVILSSYSGNTEEIIGSFGDATRAGSKILVVTSGGKIAALAEKKKIPVVKIPGGLPPRCAIGYLTFSLFPVLKHAGDFSFEDREVNEAAAAVRNVSRSLARSIARRFHSKFVCLYSVAGLLGPVAVRWRTQMAENSKTLVSHHSIPEMFHNEIEGWQFPRNLIKNFIAVFLPDISGKDRFRGKRQFAQKWIRKNGAGVLDVPVPAGSELAKMFSLIALGDWVSVELARLYKTNPLPIPILERIKKIK